MSVRFWRSAGHFGASYKALFMHLSTVPSLYRPSTDGLKTQKAAIALEPLTTHPDEWAEPSHK